MAHECRVTDRQSPTRRVIRTSGDETFGLSVGRRSHNHALIVSRGASEVGNLDPSTDPVPVFVARKWHSERWAGRSGLRPAAGPLKGALSAAPGVLATGPARGVRRTPRHEARNPVRTEGPS